MRCDEPRPLASLFAPCTLFTLRCLVQVEWLVCILRGKGPDSADLLLGALRASLEDEDHPGHQYVVQRLQEEMERATVLGVTMKEGEGEGEKLKRDEVGR